MLFKQEEVSRLQRWLSLPLGVVRATLIISFLIFFLSLVFGTVGSSSGSMADRVSRSIAGKFYLGVFSVYKRVIPGSVENKEVKNYYEAEQDL